MTAVSPKPRLVVRIVGWTLIVVSIVAAGELGSFIYYANRDGRYLSAHARFLDEINKFSADLVDRSKCAYIDSLYPHPYLAFVHKRHGPCALNSLNMIGLFGRDYPLARISTKFTILLTGGSVAAQFGSIGSGTPALEEELNRCYRPTHGKSFIVLNGADGAWKQPQQAIMYLIYGDYVDAIITLDGFNEHYTLETQRLEYPASNFATANPLVTGSYATIAAAWLSKNIISFTASNSLLNKSYVVYMLIEGLHRGLEEIAKPEDSVYKRNFDDMFSLPSEWSSEQKYEYNIEQYRNYIRAMAVTATVRHAQSAFFIQPVPAIKKVLTDEEKGVVGSLNYRTIYQKMNDDLLELSKEKISIFSLLDVFSGEKQSLYRDAVHFNQRGNELMAKVIARHLGEAWGLQRTCPFS